MDSKLLRSLIGSLRLRVLEMVDRAQSGDVAMSLAVLEVLAALYLGEDNDRPIAQLDPMKPKSASRDYVVVSDSAIVPAWYACLAEAGFFDRDELNHYGKLGALLTCIPTVKIPGVDTRVEAPGRGLAVAEGMARGLLLNKQPNRVFVVLTDEDLKLGLTWEAMMGVTYDRLANVTLICCHSGSQKVAPLQDKLEAFGWKVLKLVNGHDVKEISLGLARAKESVRQPTCVLVSTVLAKGVPFAEGKLVYRGAQLSKPEMTAARSALAKL
jgi:transketolase